VKSLSSFICQNEKPRKLAFDLVAFYSRIKDEKQSRKKDVKIELKCTQKKSNREDGEHHQ